MNRKDLTTARVVGFFSLPSRALAEHNPLAYQEQMRDLPPHSGQCAYCGTGIIHHVVIRLVDGEELFIGSDCAEKVGNESVRNSVKLRLTQEQIDQKRMEYEERNRIAAINVLTERTKSADAMLTFYLENSDLVNILRYQAESSSFFSSLLGQIYDNQRLSKRQAACVAKHIAGRRTKKNATEFDSIIARLCGDLS